jgi:threonine/homoserine/homoserine lactone efflux protein
MLDPLAFVLAVAVLLATPGPTNTLLATAAARQGIRASLPLLVAELAGYLTSVTIARVLLAPVFEVWPTLRPVLVLVLAFWLTFVAVRLWQSGTGFVADKAPRRIGHATVFITTCLNPKALVFAFVVLPFGTPQIALALVAFASLTMAAGTVWIVFGASLSALLAERAPVLVPRAAAISLSAFAILIGSGAIG